MIPTGAGNYPAGVTNNDPYFDMPNAHEDEDEPLTVTRSCERCPEKLIVTVGPDELEDDALEGALFDAEWRRIGGELFCGRCVRSIEDDEVNG